MVSDVDKRDILADFQEWSGGYMPYEMTAYDIDTYVDFTLSADYTNREEIRDFLHSLKEK